MNVVALHAGLSTADQLAVFQASERGTRKVVISTNIAEASVTIDGIRFVIDSGFVKVCFFAAIPHMVTCVYVAKIYLLKSHQMRMFNPTTSFSSLITQPISTSSATQRAGRAGRTSPGICYRLYPPSALDQMAKSTPPEVTRVDLTTPLLQLKALGIDDLMKFEWVTPPPAESVLRALEALVNAGMLGKEDARLTEVGAKVAEVPVDIGVARMVSGPSRELGV
jgi:ATP-dependent RNA helicase DDX35